MERFVDYTRKHKEREASGLGLHTLQSYGPEYPQVSNEDQVSDWEKVLYSALYNAGIRTMPQYRVDKYVLDLALFCGSRKLDIEVDGEMYHRDWNGELCYRDQLRNHRLFEMGWDVKRFWVYQIRDELSWCVSQIQEWIDRIENEHIN
ncbi:MAG: DUF559 domain-containing protein [Clostridiales bacterium]|nr:DUF559 domain-containing protein [Clostridiales bacterium]